MAIRIATDNTNRWKHGAILVKSGRVISYAPNIYKNPPQLFEKAFPDDLELQAKQIREYCSVHAEAKVIAQAGEHAVGSIIYVARVNKEHAQMLSKPCEACSKLIKESGVKKVFYTA